MAEVTTTRQINPSQLGVELGRVALRCVGPDPDGNTIVRTDAVTQGVLNTAVDAHVANDAWVDPNPTAPPPEQTAGIDLQAVRARALEVFNDPAQSFTPRQVQRLLAALVLRATR